MEQLQQVYQLIKDGQKREAIDILKPIVKNDPDNADAWWLMANAVTDPDYKRRALENVLRLRPNHVKAQNMLDGLQMQMQDDPFADLGSPGTSAYGDPYSSSSSRGSLIDTGNAPMGRQAPSGYPPPSSVPIQRPAKKGPNGCVIFLAIIGGLAVCACVGCFALVTYGGGLMANIFGENYENFVLTVTAIPNDDPQQLADAFVYFLNQSVPGLNVTIDANDLGTLSSFSAFTNFSPTLPGNVAQQGSLNLGQTQSGSFGAGQLQGWTFSGESGQTVTITVRGSGVVDPITALYSPANTILMFDDDSGGSLASRIQISLPSTGTYTIVAQELGGRSGGYEVELESGGSSSNNSAFATATPAAIDTNATPETSSK
ncbi:MAG: hypothetical protein H7175_05610 [Burkholderiales bacterium]|nr:hypothetical protein [Anaerolineae bacterium]